MTGRAGALDDAAALRALEQALWRPETRFDRTWMERVLATDFVEVGRSGRVHRREDVLAMPRREIPVALPLPGLEVSRIGADAALVTYETNERAASGTERTRRSSLWTRTADGWRLRFHQGTPAAPDAAA